MTSKVSREKSPGIQWQHNKRKSVIRIIYTQRTDGGRDTDEKWDVKTNQQKVKATRESGGQTGSKTNLQSKTGINLQQVLKKYKTRKHKETKETQIQTEGKPLWISKNTKTKNPQPDTTENPRVHTRDHDKRAVVSIVFFYLPCFSVVCIQTHLILAFLFTPTHTELQTCLISACKALHYAYFHKN